MARQVFRPQEFGVDIDRERFADIVVEAFYAAYRHRSIDELLLQPREALRFCEELRHQHGWHDATDQTILKTLVNRLRPPGNEPSVR